jgi:hypothetical protein
MRKILASFVLVLASAQFAAAQSTEPVVRGWSLGFAGGPRVYLSGAERRTYAVQVFLRKELSSTIACEVELAGGGGAEHDVVLPDLADGTPVITHFAADLGANLVYRTPGRVGLSISAGPGLYVEQRDTELRTEEIDLDEEPNVLERNNDYTLGGQVSLGVDVVVKAVSLFSVARYEVRAFRASEKLANWQVLTGVRFRF